MQKLELKIRLDVIINRPTRPNTNNIWRIIYKYHKLYF